MSTLLQLPFRRTKLGSSILGLTLDGSRLEGVVLRRTNGALQVQQSFSFTLTLDPLTNATELVGREIRNHLQSAGIRERRCVLGLPLKWALTVHTKLPELAENDLASFLQIEAERGFPCDISTLMIGTSHSSTAGGEQHALQVAVPRNHVLTIEEVLRAAQLKPVSFSLALAALQNPQVEPNGVLAVAIGESQVGLQVSCGGGIVSLRTLEGALESPSGQRHLRADMVAREARITLAQLAPEMRQAVRRVRIFGPRDLAQQLADEFDLRLEAMDLQVEVVSHYAAGDFGLDVPSSAAVSPAFSLAAAYLTGRSTRLEFLPPHVTALQQFAARYSSGKLQRAGVAAGAVALVVVVPFLFQQWQLWRLQARWNAMQLSVRSVENTTAKINQFRPWFDTSVRALTIMRNLTEAFPEDSSVTAKTIEIRELRLVTCTGVARDQGALLKTIERLRARFDKVNLGQTRGQSPAMQFTLNFVSREGGSNAN